MNNLFKKIDAFFFDLVDNFKTSSLYAKYQDSIGSQDESTKQILNSILSYFLALTPFLILFIFYIAIGGLQSKTENKREVIAIANSIINSASEFDSMSGRFLSNSSIQSKEELENRVRPIITSYNISSDKISIDDFNLEVDKGIKKSKAQINFKEISLKSFKNLLDITTNSLQSRIEGIDISRNDASKTLSGHLKIINFSKQ